MSQDYYYHDIKHTDLATGYPVDQYGCFLDKNDMSEDGLQARQLTSPYGALYFAVGNGDDFWCFDYATMLDCRDGKNRIVLDATINSETGSFIEGGGYEVVVLEPGQTPAADVALGMTDQALEWVNEPSYDWGNQRYTNIRHHRTGWGQDPYFFFRCVYLMEYSLTPGNLVPTKFSERQKRLGGKRINRFVHLAA